MFYSTDKKNYTTVMNRQILTVTLCVDRIERDEQLRLGGIPAIRPIKYPKAPGEPAYL